MSGRWLPRSRPGCASRRDMNLEQVNLVEVGWLVLITVLLVWLVLHRDP